jgi:hypothetical protein
MREKCKLLTQNSQIIRLWGVKWDGIGLCFVYILLIVIIRLIFRECEGDER